MSGSALPFGSPLGKLGVMVALAPQTSCLTTKHAFWRTQPGCVKTDPIVLDSSAHEPTSPISAILDFVICWLQEVGGAFGGMLAHKGFLPAPSDLCQTSSSRSLFEIVIMQAEASDNAISYQGLDDHCSGTTITFTHCALHLRMITQTDCSSKIHTSCIYLSCNALYSVSALTDSVGNVLERYKYEPYGAVTVMNGDGSLKTTGFVGNPYMFTGQRLDGETGLMYYKNRYYDVDLGRFVGRDPIGYFGGSFDLYEYVGAGVTNLFDPFGLKFSFEGTDSFVEAMQATLERLKALDPVIKKIIERMEQSATDHVIKQPSTDVEKIKSKVEGPYTNPGAGGSADVGKGAAGKPGKGSKETKTVLPPEYKYDEHGGWDVAIFHELIHAWRAYLGLFLEERTIQYKCKEGTIPWEEAITVAWENFIREKVRKEKRKKYGDVPVPGDKIEPPGPKQPLPGDDPSNFWPPKPDLEDEEK